MAKIKKFVARRLKEDEVFAVSVVSLPDEDPIDKNTGDVIFEKQLKRQKEAVALLLNKRRELDPAKFKVMAFIDNITGAKNVELLNW